VEEKEMNNDPMNNDPVTAYFLYKIVTSRVHWIFCGLTFLYGLAGQGFTKLAQVTEPARDKFNSDACVYEHKIGELIHKNINIGCPRSLWQNYQSY
jgi:hypothetical protein